MGKKIVFSVLFFCCLFSWCFAYANELQFRLVLTEQESKTAPFDKYIDDFGEEILVSKEILLTNSDVEKMSVLPEGKYEEPYEAPMVMIYFTTSGKTKFFEATKKYINRRIAMIVGNKVSMSPYIREAIDTGWTSIPTKSLKEAEELIKNLGFAQK